MKPFLLTKTLAVLLCGLSISSAALSAAPTYTLRVQVPGLRSAPAAPIGAPAIVVQDSQSNAVLAKIPFATTQTGSQSPTVTVNVVNNGTADFLFGSPAVTVQAPFKLLSTTCSGKLTANGTPCQISMAFAPIVSGNFDEADLVINGSGAAATAPNLTGNATSVASDPYFANVTSLMHFEGANGSTTFKDEIASNTITQVASTISTATAKFGTGSVYANGSTSRLTATNSTNFAFGTGDFTVEGWYYLTNNNHAMFFDSRPDGVNGPYANCGTDSGKIAYTVNGVDHVLVSGYTFPTNTWVHVATVRSAGVVSVYVNGVSVGSTYTDTTSLQAGRMVFLTNGGFTGNTQMSGYGDEFRVTKGVARYKSNFAVPTTAFPNQ